MCHREWKLCVRADCHYRSDVIYVTPSLLGHVVKSLLGLFMVREKSSESLSVVLQILLEERDQNPNLNPTRVRVNAHAETLLGCQGPLGVGHASDLSRVFFFTFTSSFFFLHFTYLFLERGERRGKERKRNIDVREKL